MSELRFEDLIGEVAEACLGAARATRVLIYGFNVSTHELPLLADAGTPRTGHPLADSRPLATWASAQRAISERAPIGTTRDSLATDTDRGELSTLALGGCLLLPLQIGTMCVGLLILGRQLPRRFTGSEVRAGIDLANQLALTLYNAQLLSESRARASEQAALFEVTQAAITIRELDLLLPEILRITREVTGWDACEIALRHGDADALHCVASDIAPWARVELERTGYDLRSWPSMRAVMQHGGAMHMVVEQGLLSHGEQQILTERRIESILMAPLSVSGESLGILTVLSGDTRAVRNGMLPLIREITSQAALAVQNARFLDRTKRLALEQATLLRVSQAVIAESNLEAVLAEIARVAIGLEDVEGCRILIWHPDTDQFEVAAEQTDTGWATYYSIGERYPAADWPSARGVAVTQTARGFLVGDPTLSARERANHIADQVGSFHTVPINAGNRCVGCLSLMTRGGQRIDPNAIRLGRELAAQAAHAIDRSRLVGQLQHRAESDGLTGLLNHRAVFETLDREIAAARRTDGMTSIIILDLDDFKFFNDTHGHLVGDQVLIEVARVLRDCVRPRDFVGRYGGDEFLIVMPQADPAATRLVASRVVRRIERATIDLGPLKLPVRLSIGVATYPVDAKNRQELVAFGDSSMYRAKELGGGQVGSLDHGTRSLEPSVIGALNGLVRAVDQKDRYTRVHSDLVAQHAVAFGRHLGLAEVQLQALEIAGQLHDVGKIAVPDSILRKPGHLSMDEQMMIREHVVFSELMIKGVPHLDDVLAAVAHHHERWDGQGYPRAVAGEAIPLLGRIMALADSLSAMTHDRPYRKGRTIAEAMEEIRAGAGSQFDPALAERFVTCIITSSALLKDAELRRDSAPLASIDSTVAAAMTGSLAPPPVSVVRSA